MRKTVFITLGADTEPYLFETAAGDRLEGYLDRAAAGLRDDPDRDEILGDLERSVGDRLAARLGHGPGLGSGIVTVADIEGVLEAIGAVDTGAGPSQTGSGAVPGGDRGSVTDAPTSRRLRRIRSEQELAGVCAGIAAYAEVPVDWVRTFFILTALVTAGLIGILYIVLVFTMPVVETRDS